MNKNKFSLEVHNQEEFDAVLNYFKSLGLSIEDRFYNQFEKYMALDFTESNKDWYFNSNDIFQDFERITFDEFKDLINN